MLPLALMLLFVPQSPAQSQAAYVCGDRDVRTEPLRSAAGFSAFLSVHSEDDHGKNSHECRADYALHVIHQSGPHTDGPPAFGPSGFFSSDADWNRPLVLHIDGFSPDGKRIFVLIIEGGQSSFIEAEEYDMTSGTRLREGGADRSFLDNLGAPCAATLHISGTTSDGHIVIETVPSNRCRRAQSWRLSADSRVKGSLGGRVPGIPTLIVPGTHITALDPGMPVRPATD